MLNRKQNPAYIAVHARIAADIFDLVKAGELDLTARTDRAERTIEQAHFLADLRGDLPEYDDETGDRID